MGTAFAAGLAYRVPYMIPLYLLAFGGFLAFLSRAEAEGREAKALRRAILLHAFAFAACRMLGVILTPAVLLILFLFALVQSLLLAYLWLQLRRRLSATPLLLIPAFAAAALLLDAGLLAAVPLFGQAQSLALPWIEYGPALGLVRHFGQGFAVIFAFAWVAIAALAFLGQAGRKTFAVALLLSLVLALLGRLGIEPDGRTLRLAGLGGGSQALARLTSPDIARLLEGFQGSPQQSCIVVLPELFTSRDSLPSAQDLALRQLARDRRLILAWGYGDLAGRRNALELCAEGEVLGTYFKHHLVPGIEDGVYDKGSGGPLRLESSGLRLGAVICQDDNYAGFVRLASKPGLDLLLVPTLDWPGVAKEHLDSMRWRCLENGIVALRGARGGFSAVIDADGKVKAEFDGRRGEVGLAQSEISLEQRTSLWRRGGPWPLLLLSLLMLTGCLLLHPHPPKKA
jgi:apolipoprotein N-acyltransferase